MTGVRHVVLVGLMGAGKTTVGSRVAAVVGMPFLDNDDLLGESAAVIEGEVGVDVLHRREEEVLLDAVRRPEPAVIAAAASVIESPAVREALQDVFVVWLTADADVLAARFLPADHRPRRGDDAAAMLDDMARRRAGWFRDVADLVVDTATGTIDETVRRIAAATEFATDR